MSTKTVYDKHSVQLNLADASAGDGLRAFYFLQRLIKKEDLYHDPEDHGKGFEDEPHITVLYGLEGDARRASADVRDVFASFDAGKGLELTIGEVSAFRNPEKPYDVIYASIVGCPKLHELNDALRKHTFYKNSYRDYIPHATLAYVKKGACKDIEGRRAPSGRKLEFRSAVFSGAGGRREPLFFKNLAGARIRMSPPLYKLAFESVAEAYRAASRSRGLPALAAVLRESFEIASALRGKAGALNDDIIAAAAVYHGVGAAVGGERYEERSARFVRASGALREQLGVDEFVAVAQAVAQHEWRFSRPGSIYGCILSDAVEIAKIGLAAEAAAESGGGIDSVEKLLSEQKMPFLFLRESYDVAARALSAARSDLQSGVLKEECEAPRESGGGVALVEAARSQGALFEGGFFAGGSFEDDVFGARFMQAASRPVSSAPQAGNRFIDEYDLDSI